MKNLIFSFIFSLLIPINIIAQNKDIKGIVVNANKEPLEFVNIYVKGTIDGTISKEDGSFSLSINAKDSVTLVASCIGYKEFIVREKIDYFNNIRIVMQSNDKSLNEVVVIAGYYNIKSASTIEEKTSVDLVTTAGSEGDLYKSISLLPGTQASGIDGQLIVRGGSTRETQTYIDGMHVLSPYTANSGNFGSRGRYSPFLFEGINFSMGGYSSEYSQSLSAVLPLETKNVSNTSKLGVDLMNVSVGGGGTQSWDKGSTSFNVNYTDLSLYNDIFYPSVKKYWNKPYQQFGIQNQVRFELAEDTYLKTYFAYDKTGFNLIETDLPDFTPRNLDYNEDNIYLNTTFSKKYSDGLQFFSGIAYSYNNQKIENGLYINDKVKDKEHELHLKVKASKRLSEVYKLELGTESYLRKKDLLYKYQDDNDIEFNNNIHGFYLSNDFNLSHSLFLNLSGRLEYSTLNSSYAFLPRVALGYTWNRISFSGVIGLYQQNADNDYLMYNNKLEQEKNVQSLLGIYYQHNNKIYRIELYNKQYRDLTRYHNKNLVSDGRGHSRGIDLFFSDTRFLKYWNYMIAYSYNDTERDIEDYPVKVTPNYTTKHNISFTLKYTNYQIKSVIGLTNRFASGRKYHNPNKSGYMNSTTPVYNTLDLSYTFLAHKKLIIYASFSNIFNRQNIFNYQFGQKANGEYVSRPIKLQQNQSFYIGFFLTLGKNVAYDVSNF